MPPDISSFRHRYPYRVRTFHVDRQNVVHNAWYFYFLEEARVEFMRELGIFIDEQSFISHTKFFVVHNSCNYLAPAFFDDELTIGSRVESIGSSSVTFEHLIVNAKTGATIATAKHVLVYVDAQTNQPAPVPAWIREKAEAYERMKDEG